MFLICSILRTLKVLKSTYMSKLSFKTVKLSINEYYIVRKQGLYKLKN